jgi:hypothetical protein
MAANAGEDENHWPGYVDALTTMTMMLIFVMTILAVAIFGLSQNVSRSMVEKIARVIDLDITDPQEATDRLAERVVARLEAKPSDTQYARAPAKLREELEPEHRLASTDAPPAPVAPAPALVEQKQALITVAFQRRATGLDGETTAKIKTALSAGGTDGVIEMRAFADKASSVSDARRIAFYRLLNLRTEMIRMGIPADRIKARIEDAAAGFDGDMVRIDLASAG